MRWLIVVVTIALGCSDDGMMPFVVAPPQEQFDAGVQRVCGVVPGSACEGEGEITRCLCGSFEEQIGRFVCCRGGQAVVLECQQARYAQDCDGKLASGADSGVRD